MALRGATRDTLFQLHLSSPGMSLGEGKRGRESGSQETWVLVPAVPLTLGVTAGTLSFLIYKLCVLWVFCLRRLADDFPC